MSRIRKASDWSRQDQEVGVVVTRAKRGCSCCKARSSEKFAVGGVRKDVSVFGPQGQPPELDTSVPLAHLDICAYILLIAENEPLISTIILLVITRRLLLFDQLCQFTC